MTDYTIQVVDGLITVIVNGETVVDAGNSEVFSGGSESLEILRSLILELECLVG